MFIKIIIRAKGIAITNGGKNDNVFDTVMVNIADNGRSQDNIIRESAVNNNREIVGIEDPVMVAARHEIV